jgi:hypothetical protein
MAQTKPSLPSEEFHRRGTEFYERSVRPALRPEDGDKFVAIDVVTGGYEIDANDYLATERLLQRQPDAEIWLMRVGQPAAYRIGGRAASPGHE